MKKHILGLVTAAAIIGSIAAGCSSNKSMSSSGTDTTTMKDTSKMATPAPAPADTAKKDTMKKATTHH